MRRYLVIANQTLAGEHLTQAVREALATGPCEFYVLVPASHANHHAVWTEGAAKAEANSRLTVALERFRALGAEATGEVGDPSPLLALRDVLRHQIFDEIIVSTLPSGPSRWLRQDVVNRMRRITSIPVRHIVGAEESVAAR
jgi:GABA permease